MRIRSVPPLAAAALLALAAPALADPAGRTTLDETIVRSASGVAAGPGRPHAVRGPAVASANRDGKRRSLAFFAQLTDAQLADEMSPARLEYLRPLGRSPQLWRPHEALGPQTFDQAVRNVNRNALSPVADGEGRRSRLQFAVVTGDLSDNHQHNEVRWGVRILEGGQVDPFSGKPIRPGNRCPDAPAATVRRLNAAVAARRYTGVQDYADYPGRPARRYGGFWDPDAPPPAGGHFAGFSRYPGLMERAQRPFLAEGLALPWYATRGNHDALAQGFFGGGSGASIATGCRKMLPPRRFGRAELRGNPWSAMSQRLRRRGFAWVPPDPARRFVSSRTFKWLHGRADRGHGFRSVARGELRRSRGAASYYAWSPRPGLRFIALDTVGEGGGSDGNIDHPQYRWLQRELRRAQRRDQLVVVYGHHSLETMQNPRSDERAGRCARGKLSCDADPRRSTPLHLGLGGRESLRSLLLRVPNVVLFVTGHVHYNHVIPHFRRRGQNGFWQVTTASHMSFPQQTRLIEIMDNDDGTLSIFGTVLDTAAPIQPPPSGSPAASLGEAELGSVSRLLAASVRTRARASASAGPAAAPPRDAFPASNVELLLRDPRRRR